MTQIPAEIESVYAKIKASNGVSSKHDEMPANGVYFALKYRIPNGRIQFIFWSIWRWCQLYAPVLLQIVGFIGIRTRWADNQFRKFTDQVIDGNAFAQKAIENGAAFAVIDNPSKHRPPQTILVEDVAETLYALGRYHRQHIDVPVIGITGSVGKTTTTHLINAILSKKMITACKFGSNSAIANSINLLNAPAASEAIVLEMSAIRRGFLNAACDIMRPTHGLITNTGLAHLDTFGSLENIQKGKWELFEKITAANGTVFLNMNQPWLASQAHHVEKAIRFGSQPGNHVVGHLLSADP
ncbi:MAG: Mur ligase family protein, partial [Anaerolineae bacterium]